MREAGVSRPAAIAASASLCVVAGPCGHESDFDQACLGPDRYLCPECGVGWAMVEEAPQRLPSGFVLPGRRVLQIGGAGE
jgi:hypothetical protein